MLMFTFQSRVEYSMVQYSTVQYQYQAAGGDEAQQVQPPIVRFQLQPLSFLGSHGSSHFAILEDREERPGGLRLPPLKLTERREPGSLGSAVATVQYSIWILAKLVPVFTILSGGSVETLRSVLVRRFLRRIIHQSNISSNFAYDHGYPNPSLTRHQHQGPRE